jgi:AraC-like DNA-binding protein
MDHETPVWFVSEWRNTGFAVNGIYGMLAERGNRSRGFARDLWTYVVVTAGALALRQGAWKEELGPGDQVLLLPHSPFTREVVSATCRWYNVDFRVQSTGLGANPLPSLGLPAVVHDTLQPSLLALLEEACMVPGTPNDWVLNARGIADRLVGQYVKTGIRSGAIAVTHHTPVPAWLSTVRMQIAKSFADDVSTLAGIVRKSGFSRSHFDRSFKHAFGATPMEFLWEQRLQMAVRKLDTGPQIPVSEIAAGCGFKSHTHFTRMFRQRFGMTPRQWRRRRLDSPPSDRGGS